MRIPRELLHLDFEGLAGHAIGSLGQAAVRRLLADLPLVPRASDNALLLGPPEFTLPALVVLARRVGQGLRDANLAIAHDRSKLAAQRHKLIFLSATELAEVLALGDTRPHRETVLFVHDAQPDVAEDVLRTSLARQAHGLATFVTSRHYLTAFAHWRVVEER